MSPTLTEPADSELLARFVRERDEGAFQSLVGRHQAMVTGAALRRTGDRELSRDVAQRVFVTLARKADRLVTHARLGGWLYKTSSFEASRALQSEQRRRMREQIAADVQVDSNGESANWEALEDALAAMPDAERELIVMRYFEDRSYAEIAADLGLTEAATRKRLSRALADLGRRLSRGGVAAPASKLLVGAVAIQAALPVEQSLAAAAIASATKSSLLPTLMTSTTAKSCAAVLALAVVPLTLQWSENKALAKQLASAKPAAAMVAFDPADGADLLALREQVAAARARVDGLNAARAAEAERSAKLEGMLETLGTELVVSVGDVDTMASECADLILEFARISEMEDEGEMSKVMGEILGNVMKLMPTVVAALSLDERPELNARFYAGIFGKALDLDEKSRAEFAAALLPAMERTKEDGLLVSQRPQSAASIEEFGESEWDKRYIEASVAYARAVEPLMPPGSMESGVWKMFAQGEYAGLLMMLGSEESPLGAIMHANPGPARPPATSAVE